MKKTDELM